MKKHQTTFRFDEKEKEAIRLIREHYGVSSDIDAVRIALRETVRTLTQPPQPQTRNAIHPPRE